MILPPCSFKALPTQGNDTMLHTKPIQGLSLIELLIVIAIFATLLSLALPTYQDHTVRAKVSEGLSMSAGAKAAVAEFCQTSPTASIGSIVGLGYSDALSSKYVRSLEALSLGADCTRPVIGFEVINSGAEIAPIIALVGQLQGSDMHWQCVLLAGEPRQVPPSCRGLAVL